ncbi:MAG: helix-turn-helix domain-containing protein [Novosphingobium sp.]
MSYNRAPAADIAPWIARLYATSVEAPADYRLECGLFTDTSVVRIQLKGDWTAQTATGPLRYGPSALHFGPHSKLMPVTVTGSFVSIGISLRPGAGYALFGTKAPDFVDRIVPCQDLGLPVDAAMAALNDGAPHEEWLLAMEVLMRQIINGAGAKEPDPLSARFEAASLVDPSFNIADFAAECGVDQRKLERVIKRDFGLPPKQVLRRARILDMASFLRGVADHAEGDEMALRFYDQSHLIREFTALLGMSPKQFVSSSQPILTLALESRQARRLEAIDRLGPGEQRPWQ